LAVISVSIVAVSGTQYPARETAGSVIFYPGTPRRAVTFCPPTKSDPPVNVGYQTLPEARKSKSVMIHQLTKVGRCSQGISSLRLRLAGNAVKREFDF
jgi:hypothetical protein